MKTIKGTFIDNGGHGYLSISKKDIIKIKYPYKNISHCSGHNLTRVFLEEDLDAENFVKFCRENNIPFDFKESYNDKFKTTHNFNPDLFNAKLNVGDKYVLCDDSICEVILNDKKLVVSVSGMRYKIPKTNPFQYISKPFKI